ncbi:group 1 glycosyl transferase [Pedobacter ginsengisoli]|uniref:Group 1 glycosyl transferase n=1 Tax=Pedobacter ginsengisoli TaxID=363852 RepID=A0A2D1U8S6_9SPHI|nr:glycosyltransferase family 4 protein [Pedobacter ginsengisoli]ATP57980.1 group 1 glycosyl transferase [Pedobacter ginsengisoli]
MNILILHSSSDLYGASNVLFNVIKVLKNNGNNPIVVLSEEGPLSDKLRNHHIEVHIIRLGILRRKYFSLTGIINRLLILRKADKSLRELIAEKNIKLVYSHTTAVLVGALVAHRLKLKHIWHVLEITTKPLFFVRTMGWLLNKYSTSVITASDAVKAHWSQWVEPKKLKTIYNGLDCSPFTNKTGDLKKELNLSEQTLLIGMIGRVHFWKGQDYFIRIAAEILKIAPNAKFVMAGDAFPGYEYLYKQNQQIIDEKGINDKIFNLGYRTDIVNIMNSLDVFVLPSLLPDPFPTVVLEAMAAGKAIAATRQGGAVEMIADSDSGLLIPIDDAKAAAVKMFQLINSAQERERMGNNAAIRVRKLFSEKAFEMAIIETFTGAPKREPVRKEPVQDISLILQD